MSSPRSRSARSLPRLLTALTALGVSVAGAQVTFPVQQNFKTNTAPGWTLGGNATLTSGGADASGDGWLRLTTNGNNQTGYALLNNAFSATQGVVVDFDFASWGGSGADGISFFLFDGATITPRIGAFGGSLGYAQKTAASGAVPSDIPGVANGFIGIGIDEYGNYSNPTEGRSLGPGFVQDAVAIRGPGNGAATTDYQYVTGAAVPFTLDITGTTTRPLQTGSNFRHARLIIQPNRSTTVQITNGQNAPTTIINNYAYAYAAPSTLKLGFGASTGGLTNFHEIRNVSITQPTDLKITKTDNSATAYAGGPIAYTITVTNAGQNTVPGAVLTDVVPATITGVTWTCAASSGSSCAAASGSGNNITTTSTLTAGGTATYTVQGTVSASASGTLSNTATVTAPNSHTDLDAGNNSATDTSAVTSAGTPYSCDARFYQLRVDASGTTSNLYLLDRRNLSSGGTSQWTTGFGTPLNALGFNDADGYFYALNITPFTSGAPYRLYRLGRNGAVEFYSTTLPAGGNIAAATVDAAGVMYIHKQGAETALYRIQLPTSVGGAANMMAPLTLTQSTAIFDLAFNPVDGFLYGVLSPGGALKINVANGQTTTLGSFAAVNATNAIGSAFFDVSGALYAYQNGGTYGLINTSNGTFTALATAIQASQSDGASCVFPDNRMDVVKSAGTVTAISTRTFDVPYTVTVKNTGPVTNPNVQVTENLRATFSAGTPALSLVAGPTVTSGTLTAQSAFDGTSNFALFNGSGSLAPGASATVTFTVRVAYPDTASVPASTAQQNNTVYASTAGTANAGHTFVSGTPVPPVDLLATDTSTNSSAVPTTANSDTPSATPVTLPDVTDLSIDKAGAAFAKSGDAIVYTLTVTNSGPRGATAVSVTDALPVGLTYVSSSPAATVSGQTLTWTLGTLAVSDTRTITVTASAPNETTLVSTAAARNLTNTATVSTMTAEPNTSNNTDAVTTQMIAAKLTKSVQNVTQKSAVGTAVGGLPGDVLEYCIAFQNIGGVALPNFLLTDDVPGNTAAQTNGYDQEPTAVPGSGVKLTRSATTYLTSSAADTDAGSLSTTAGQYGQGTLRVTLGSLAVGEQGSACFRTVIR
ncbi:DUF6923 family protein [Deinococcus sedimenti]|uniref:DUF11 domain-containing protein n=1 Tax=Deinococcus sedimenti TaxID=1867090 RepID=A0ABQ2S6E1_9DEIO|nr:DUF11 domain-containing protein [Deinococcus sedimenti]GGS01876.1 hypothetical protein GCM10008960_30670 [Deinococcus sedimenti]